MPVLLAGIFSSVPAFAADFVWSGGSSNTWSTAANWSGGVPTSASTTAVFFGAAAANRHSPSITASTTIGFLTFNSGATSYTLSTTSTNNLTLASGGSVTNSSGTLQTISGSVVLGGGTTWNAASGDLIASGVLSGATGSLIKSGTGTLILSGANTYAGGTTISVGTLQVGNASTTGTLGAGSVTNNSILSFNRSNAFTVANAIGGSGSVNQVGSGVTSLTATNTYQGGTTISGGVLQFSSSSNLGTGAVTLNGGAIRWATGNTEDIAALLVMAGGALDTNGNNITLATALSGTGSLIKTGAGILTLGAAPTSTTKMVVNGGTLRGGTANVFSPGDSLTVNATAASGSATFDLNGFDTTIGALTLGGTNSGANAINTVSTGSATLTLGGNVTYSTPNSSSDPGTASITGKLDLGSSTRTFNLVDSANTGTELNISANISGTGAGITVSGTGVLALSGSNTYTGTTNINGATLQFTSVNNLGTGPVRFGGGNSTLRWAAGNTDDVSGLGINMAGSSTFDTNGNNVTLASTLSGGGWLYKVGTGSLTINSAPSLVKAFIRNGTLRLSGDNALPSFVDVTVGNTIDNGSSTLDLNGHDLTVGALELGVYYSGRLSTNTVTTGLGTLTLGGNVTYAIEGDPYEYYDPGTATIAGKLNLGASTRTFNIADSYNTALELNVTADVSGAGGINKTGLGVMALSGTNTYSGNTIITDGTLRAILPGTTNLQMNGGVFEIAADRSFVYGTGAGQIQWTGGGGGFSAYGGNRVVDIKDTGGTSINLVWGGGNFVANGSNLILSSLASDSTVTLANNIDLGGAVQTVVVNGGTAAINAELSGIISNGGLNITGGGTLKLSGTNTYSGGTTISSYTNPADFVEHPTTVEFASGGLGTGSVTLSGSSTLRWATGNTDGLSATATLNFGSNGETLDTNGNNVVLNAALSATTVTLTKAGIGTLTLNANSPNFNGYVNITGGTLKFGVAGALGSEQYGFATINATTPNGSATLDTNNQDYSVYGLYFGGAGAQANAMNTFSSGTGTLFYTTGGPITYTKATLDANDPGSAYLSGNLNIFQGALSFAIDDSTNTTTELTVNANISSTGTLGITKTGAGVLVLGGTNTYTGNTTLNGGTLRVTSSRALSTGTLTISSGTLELAGNGITLTNTIALGSAVRTISGLDGSAVVDATLSGKISGTGGINKTNAGTLRLSGTNTYSGATTVTAGTLDFAKANSLLATNWTAAKLIVQSGATAAFNVGGAGEFTSANIDTLKALGTSTGGFRNGSFLGLDTTNASGSFTYSSNIGNTNTGANSIGLNKLGTGMLALTGSNSYTGGTIITTGTVQVGTGGTSGNLGTGGVTNHGALIYNRSDTLAESNAISGEGSVTQAGAGTLLLTGSNTYTGGTTITTGTVQLGAGGTSGNLGTGGVTNHGALVYNRSNTVTESNAISGDGILTQAGVGTLILSGASTYTGVTTVNSGKLQVDGSIANSATIVNGGTLQGKGTTGSVTMNAGSTLMAGDSTTLANFTMGDLVFNPNATLQLKLDSSLAQSDTLIVTGHLVLNETDLALNDLAALPQTLLNGIALTLLSYGDGMGDGLGTGTDLFRYNGQDLTEGSTFTVGSNTFRINYAVGDPTVTVTAVPEPGTWLLLALGLGLVAFIRSRKRSNARR